MRMPPLYLLPLAGALILVGCHGDPPNAENEPANAQPPTSQASVAPVAPVASAAPIAIGVAHPAKPKSSASAQDIAQLDLDSEGGVRDGSYAMWVHVGRRGQPLRNVEVSAYDDSGKAVAAGRTNQDGDAMLKVHATSYRIAASLGGSHTEQKIMFHPGDQFELDLQP